MGLPGPVRALMSAVHGPVYARRLKELVARIVPHLKAGDRVLDVGCGNGTLGKAIMDHPGCPSGVQVEGAERVKRGGEPIPVIAFDGKRLPTGDGSYDAVILADVLHHEEEPDRLIAECARVSRRLVIIKDHQVKGVCAQARISLIDWAANAPYGVPCLYRYNTPDQWRGVRERHGLVAVEELSGMRLYPAGFELLFGGGLQYLAVLKVGGGVRG